MPRYPYAVEHGNHVYVDAYDVIDDLTITLGIEYHCAANYVWPTVDDDGDSDLTSSDFDAHRGDFVAAVKRAVLARHVCSQPDRRECPDFEHRGPHHGAHGAPDDEWADEHGWQPSITHDPADRRIYRVDQPIRGVVLAGVGGRVDWAERDGVLHITVTPR